MAQRKPVVMMRFFSDTNLGHFVEGLDFLIPGNFWDVDYGKLIVKFYTVTDDMEEAKRRAVDLGADIFD